MRLCMQSVQHALSVCYFELNGRPGSCRASHLRCAGGMESKLDESSCQIVSPARLRRVLMKSAGCRKARRGWGLLARKQQRKSPSKCRTGSMGQPSHAVRCMAAAQHMCSAPSTHSCGATAPPGCAASTWARHWSRGERCGPAGAGRGNAPPQQHTPPRLCRSVPGVEGEGCAIGLGSRQEEAAVQWFVQLQPALQPSRWRSHRPAVPDPLRQ